MRIFFLLQLFCLSILTTNGQITPKTYEAVRVAGFLKIDGKLDEEAWRSAKIAGDFIQFEPTEAATVTQRTEVRFMYDNTSIYIGAMMYDTAPDSILHELGNRDEGRNLNADAFRFGLDTYNKRLDGYVFEVTASGVQTESLNNDFTFDAVWQSAVYITNDGWSVELRIPYSAIRFPDQQEQLWAIQFARLIRRYREYDQWTLTPKEFQNPMNYWGTLTGVREIEPPLRLSLTPYLSFYDEVAPAYVGGEVDHYENSYSYSGGADLKLGINESFTVDMTLLPDFSQVQSDNKIKNLTAFEQIFEERRPFFKEGVNLFNTGKLFYSRRIGKTPTLFYSVLDSMQEGEELVKNPSTARLTNATKLSGRTKSGLGIGILNAVTGTTTAEIMQTNGEIRKVETEPLTNYSILVFDQQLKNNSSVWLVNTNTLREGKARDANVFSTGTVVENKSHSIRFTGRYANSRVYEWITKDNEQVKNEKTGNQISLSLDKISGELQYGGSFEVGDKNYDKNDLGFIFLNDYSDMNLYLNYNKFNPFWKHFRQGSATAWIWRGGKWSLDNEMTNLQAGTNLFLLFNNNWSIYADGGSMLEEGRDWFEPRTGDQYFRTPVRGWTSLNITTNYNKKLAFDFGAYTNFSPSIDYIMTGYYLVPMLRISDRFNIKLNNNFEVLDNDRGFCTFSESGQPVFGRRDIKNVINTLTARYLFKVDMSLALNLRHYWSQGDYDQYYDLEEDGTLSERSAAEPGGSIINADFNANFFNIDLVYNWVFAPGSSFIITYKNQIASENQDVHVPYFTNLSNTLNDPQTNSIALKILYFLDYERVTHKLASRK